MVKDVVGTGGPLTDWTGEGGIVYLGSWGAGWGGGVTFIFYATSKC